MININWRQQQQQQQRRDTYLHHSSMSLSSLSISPSLPSHSHKLVFLLRCFLLFFGRSFAKRFAPCYRTVVCPSCPVCNMAKLLDILGCHFVWRQASALATLCYMGTLSPKRGGHSPQFWPMSVVAQTAGWIKMPLGTEVVLGPDDIVLDGDPAPPPQKRGGAPSPIFGPCLLWPNGWMDQDATWYGGSPRSKPHCVTWGPSITQTGHSCMPHPIFSPCLLWPNGRPSQLLLSTCLTRW